MKQEFNFTAELVNSLPEKERTVIVSYQLGLKTKQIASQMGIGESRVHQIKAKALKRLEMMSQRLYIVLEQNEWDDGFYVNCSGQRFGDLPTAMRYISEMRKIYIELAIEQGRTITQDVWETDEYSILCDDKGWKQTLFIKEMKSRR